MLTQTGRFATIPRHPVEEVASICRELGAEAIGSPARYPGCEGGHNVGAVDLEEVLRELKGQEVVLIIAP